MDPMEKEKIILKKAYFDPVFFAEHFLVNKEMENYKLEPQQRLFLRDKSPYKILFCSRRSGKTLTMIIDILWKAFCRPNQQILLLSPTEKQSKSFAETYNDMIFRSPLLESAFISRNKRDSQLDNGTRVAFGTAGTASGRSEDSAVVGSGPDILYLDEAQSLPEASMGTILPIFTGQTSKAELVLAGTPRTRSDFFYNSIQNAKSIRECYVNNGKAKPCPNNGRFSLHRYQVTDLDADGNVAYSRSEYRLTIDELELVKESIGEQKFRREYCLQFLDTLSQPYYTELRNMAGIEAEPRLFEDQRLAVGGIDFGKNRNNSVLSIGVEDSASNRWKILYYKTWELGTPYPNIIHYLENILPLRFPRLQALAIDKTGVGNALSDFLKLNAPYDVYDIIFSQPSKISLVENSIHNMESRFVTYYPHKTLNEEMEKYTREVTENDRIVYVKGTSDDFVDSFNLCNIAITKYIEEGPKRTEPFYIGGLGINALNNTTPRNNKYNKRG